MQQEYFGKNIIKHFVWGVIIWSLSYSINLKIVLILLRYKSYY